MITMFHSCNLLDFTVCMAAHSYIQMRNTKWFVMAIQIIFAFSFSSLASYLQRTWFDYRAEYNYNIFMFVCCLPLPRLFFSFLIFSRCLNSVRIQQTKNEQTKVKHLQNRIWAIYFRIANSVVMLITKYCVPFTLSSRTRVFALFFRLIFAGL